MTSKLRILDGLRPLLLTVILTASFANQAWSQPNSSLNLACLANQIELHETGGQDKNLVFWSEREAFPSLGIGHFIWLPAGSKAPFEPTFHLMAQFVNQQIPAPKWALAKHSIWQNRQEFLTENPAKIAEIQAWLQASKQLQAKFILARFNQKIEPLLIAFPDIADVYQQLNQTAAGQFAMIDYLNFKGLGTNPTERYQNQGWGLLQVLQQMQANRYKTEQLLAEFAQAADQVLTRRTQLAPNSQQEAAWLPGWRARIANYSKQICN